MNRIAVGGLLALVSAAQGQTILATRGNELFRVNGNQVDQFTLTDSLHTLCRTSSGRLLGISNSPVQGLVEIYELVGAETNNPTLVQVGSSSQRYPALAEVNGTLYATRDVDFLVTLDNNTFSETNVQGNLGLPQGIGGMGYDAAHDRLYLTDFATDNLYRIDYANSTTSLVGPVGVDFRNQGAEWYRGRYYTALERVDTAEFVLGHINVANGAFTQTLVLDTGITFPAGATVGLAVIPAPGAAAILGLAGLGFGRRRR
jgi:hypothetical protein